MEPEFILVNAQILALRVLKMRTAILFQTQLDQDKLEHSLPKDLQLPEPITNYLEGFGILRFPTGEVLVPDIVLPRFDPAQPFMTGFLPSVSEDAFHNNTHWELNSSMVQFGKLIRAIVNAHAGLAYGAGNAFTQVDPANPGPADVHLTRHNTLPRYVQLRPPHRDRVGKLTNPFIFDAGGLEAIGFNHQLISHYALFLDRAKKSCSMKSPPVTTAGTLAMCAYSAPEDGNAVTFPERYLFFSYAGLSLAEQHAARLFRYRQVRPRNDNCSELPLPGAPHSPDYNASFLRSPTSQQLSTMTIAAVPSYSSYMGHFVRHFLKPI